MKEFLKCLCLLAVLVLSAKLFVVLDHLGKSVTAVRGDLHEIAEKSGRALDDSHALMKEATVTVQAARVTINEARPKIKLTLDDSHHLLLEAGLTAKEARLAAVEQRAYWNQTGKETVALLGKVNVMADDLDKTMISANKAMQDTDAAIQHADLIISDPAIKETLQHADGTMANVEKVSAKFAKPSSIAKAVWMGILDVSYKLATFFK